MPWNMGDAALEHLQRLVKLRRFQPLATLNRPCITELGHRVPPQHDRNAGIEPFVARGSGTRACGICGA